MDELNASYELSAKESAGVTKLAVLDSVVLLNLVIVALFVFQGNNAPIKIPGLELKFPPIDAFLMLQGIHFILGLWALVLGDHATKRMESFRGSNQLRVFRDAGTILSSRHAVYGLWRLVTAFLPVCLTAAVSQDSWLACSVSFLASMSWITLWTNTVSFRQPEVGPVTIVWYLKLLLSVAYFAAWVPVVVLKRIFFGNQRPI